MNEPDWAGYKQRERGHNAGDHSQCGERQNCRVADRLRLENDQHLMAVALRDKLESRGIDPRDFFGDAYDDFRSKLDMTFPDYDYLLQEPDPVHRLECTYAYAPEFTAWNERRGRSLRG